MAEKQENDRTNKQITKGKGWLQMSSCITAPTISLRCSPSGSSLIFKLTLTGSAALLYSYSQNTQRHKNTTEMYALGFCLHTHTFSTSLLPSLCSLQRSILLFQLKSLLEVSYSVRHTMQICDCRRAFGPSNYPKPP